MSRRHVLTALVAIAGTVAAGCTSTRTSAPDTAITVYSASGLGDWYKSQFEKFTSETGVAVNLFEAGSGELVSRVNSRAVWERVDGDKSVPPADLLVVLPPFIQKAAKAGVLEPDGVTATGISSELADPAGMFVPIVTTALCFIVNPGTDPRPVTWEDLLRPALKGKVQYSTPGAAGDGTALLLLLQRLMGRQAALDYLSRLQTNNVGPASSTGSLQAKVDSGELSVANGDVQMNLAAIKSHGMRFSIFFPAMPDNSRTTVSMSYVAGVTAASRRPEEARKLLELLLSDDAQRAVHSQASGIPVRDSIAREAARDRSGTTPAGLLTGVDLWVPDWNTVLAELDGDLEAYKKAVQ